MSTHNKPCLWSTLIQWFVCLTLATPLAGTLPNTPAAASAIRMPPATPLTTARASQTRSAVIAQTNPFGKLTPINGATEVPTRNVSLMWTPLANALYYDVCIGLAGNVCNVASITHLTNADVTLPQLPSGTNFVWQVKAVTPAETVPADGGQSWTFRTVHDPSLDTPGPFSKLNPPSGAVITNPAALKFAWQPAQYATHYEFCLGFNSTACAVSLITTSTVISAVAGMMGPGTAYRWQVTAVNRAGRTPANFGASWLFTTTQSAGGPGPFGKVSPAPGAINLPLSGMTFTWQTSAGAMSYKLCIGSAPNSCSVLFSTPMTHFTPPPQFRLLPNAAYFWQVTAVNAAGQARANQGEAWSFSTLTETNAAGVLAVYALAFDTPASSTTRLSAYYQPTIRGLVSATLGQPGKVAVVLADLDEDGDSHMLVVRNGEVTPVRGLPAPSATPPVSATNTLSTSLTEVDMTNPAVLGSFIRWARRTYPAARTVFSFIGHGAALFPETDLDNVFGNSNGTAGAATLNALDWLEGGIGPLPTHIGVHPDYTDAHPEAVLSTVDLSEALRIGTDNGLSRFDVIDIVHCFAATIEEIYPLRAFGAAVTASPSYAYFDPPMAGGMLAALPQAQSPQLMATAIVRTYDQMLPGEEHPRILTAVDTALLQDTKLAWDRISASIIDSFDGSPQDTRDSVTGAYLASAKYDTTLCAPQDWRLEPPDALSDMAEFVAELGQQFAQHLPGNTDVLSATATAAQLLAGAIITTVARDGHPWFAQSSPPPLWSFTGAGLALYTDFQGTTLTGTTYLSYQASWYTHTRSALNPKPYGFVLTMTPPISRPVLPTWADVLGRFWATATVETAACLPTSPPALQTGELAVLRVLGPLTRTAYVSAPVPLQALVGVSQATLNPVVRFSVWGAMGNVFSTTIGAGYLVTGEHFVQSPMPWVPPAAGVYTVEIRIDPDEWISESNELDNAATASIIVVDTALDTRPAISGRLAGDAQWASAPTVTLAIFQHGLAVSAPARRLIIQAYQFTTQIDAFVLAPRLVATVAVESPNLPIVPFTLPAAIGRGPVVLHIWAENDHGRSLLPAVVWLNYAPPGTPIELGEEHYYLFQADRGDSRQIDLAVPAGDDASLFVWHPYNHQAPDGVGISPGNDTVLVDAPVPGVYLVSVRGETAGGTTYTITLSPGPDNNADAPMVRLAGSINAGARSTQPAHPSAGANIPPQRPQLLLPGPELAQTALRMTYLPIMRKA